MNIKRLLSGIILFPIFAILMVFGDTYLIDLVISIVAIMCLHEFYKAFRCNSKPIEWVGYIAAGSIALIHLIPSELVLPIIAAIIPVSILVLFTRVILSDLKLTITDIAITFFGICYIVLFLMFAPIIRANIPNGKILIWFVFLSAWGTDVFAYIVGKNFGKHKFTAVSPKKTIEGCLGGIVGATLLILAYTAVCNNAWGLNINYLYAGVIAVLLSCISQIGDLSASTIKRFCNIKDYSNLIPGHGGMLDRIDSIMFIAPFAYILLSLL